MPNISRGSIIVPTAGPTLPHPFKVEWKKGTDFKCFCGIIYDKENLAAGEWEPTRFPDAVAQQMYVTKSSMSPRQMNRTRTKMASQTYATGAKTGSLKLHSKATYGRCTATAVAITNGDGCAKWDESVVISAGNTVSTYLILHKVGVKWCLSWVNEADLTVEDIRICVIKALTGGTIARWQVIQLWKSDLFVGSTSVQAPNYHFQIHAAPVFANPATPLVPTTCRLKVEYDVVYDNNMLADSMPHWCIDSDGTVNFGQNPNTGHEKTIVTYTPVIASVPLSINFAVTPHIDTAVSGYLYLHFYRNHAITQGTTHQSTNQGQINGFVTDEITLVEIVFDVSSSLEDNSTISEYWSRIGLVVIDTSTFQATSIVMNYNLLRITSGMGTSIVRTAYGGNFSVTTWVGDYTVNPATYSIDQQAYVSGNLQFTQAYNSLSSPSLV